jgi:DNA-binding NarL/FixJ family response regulator
LIGAGLFALLGAFIEAISGSFMPYAAPLDVSRDAVAAELVWYRSAIMRLSPRQLDVAKDIVMCLTAEESAEHLGLGHKTVNSYRSVILRTFGVRSCNQLIRIMTLAGY